MCFNGGCIPRCPVANTIVLPAIYEKTCDQAAGTCTLLTTPADHFLSVPEGTDTGYAVFDTSVIPAGRTLKDAVFVLYPAGAGSFGGSYVGPPTANPAASPSAHPPMDGTLSLGVFYNGGSLTQAGFFGLPSVASAIWLRNATQSAKTTLLALVAGWRAGTIPNYGISFILDVGQATTSKGSPPMALAVCLDP
jgi:hypothetical protein